MEKYKILICGNNYEWCQNLSAAFNENAIFEVGPCAETKMLIPSCKNLYPDVVIWLLEENDAVSHVKELKAKCPFVMPVTIVNNPRMVNLPELIKAGVWSCLPGRLLPRQMVRAVELVVRTGIFCLPRLDTDFFISIQEKNGPLAFDTLTEREKEIYNLIKKNLSNKEISKRLFISISTVKSHLRSLFKKLGVRNRTEAIALVS